MYIPIFIVKLQCLGTISSIYRVGSPVFMTFHLPTQMERYTVDVVIVWVRLEASHECDCVNNCTIKTEWERNGAKIMTSRGLNDQNIFKRKTLPCSSKNYSLFLVLVAELVIKSQLWSFFHCSRRSLVWRRSNANMPLTRTPNSRL